jgi:fumarate hydratase subunit alpha
MEKNTIVKNVVKNLVRLATTDLPEDVESALRKRTLDEIGVGKDIADSIIVNFETARETSTVMCQDTGFPIFFVKIGENYPFEKIKNLKSTIKDALGEATFAVPIRPNTVNVMSGENPGDNSGDLAPFINIDLIENVDYLELAYFPKGGGSENMSSLSMLKPGQGIKGIKEAVLKTVINAHSGQPCNPIVVSVGVGGGADVALKIAKKSILYRKIGERNPNPEIAAMEEELLEAINQIGYGPMGLGGKTTAFEVFVEFGMRHPASLPVGVLIQCWANRRAIARIYPDDSVEFLSHKVEPDLVH